MMVPLPPTSEAAWRQAMAEFETIFHADPKTGTPEAARLDALNEAIMVYEANNDLDDDLAD